MKRIHLMFIIWMILQNQRVEHTHTDFQTFLNKGKTDRVIPSTGSYFNTRIERGPPTSSDHSQIVMTISARPIALPITSQFYSKQADWEAYEELCSKYQVPDQRSWTKE